MAIIKIRDKDGQIYEIPALRGPQGVKGDKGDKGDPGLDNLPNISTLQGVEVTITLEHNKEYWCEEPLTSLTIEDFVFAENGKSSMWALQFIAGEGIVVNVPEKVKWAVANPVFEQGCIYWMTFVPLVNGNILGAWMSDEQISS